MIRRPRANNGVIVPRVCITDYIYIYVRLCITLYYYSLARDVVGPINPGGGGGGGGLMFRISLTGACKFNVPRRVKTQRIIHPLHAQVRMTCTFRMYRRVSSDTVEAATGW